MINSEITKTIRDLEFDPDTHFYLKLSPEHVKHVAPFFKAGEHVLLTLIPFYNRLEPEDLCVVTHQGGDHVLIYVKEEGDTLVFRPLNPPEIFSMKKEECKAYKILRHEK